MKKAFIRFISTQDDVGLFIVRIIFAIVFLAHGLQKFGFFGGGGYSASMSFFTSLGIPAVLAFLVVMAESLGSLALLFGFFARIMALGIGMDMLGALLIIHLPNGFFMNWSGKQKGEGFEYHLLAIAIALLLMINGSGKFSFDRLIVKLLHKE